MLIIIQGLISSGKDYLCKALQENGIDKLVGYTTRAMRIGEVNGVEYHFIDKQTYHTMNDAQPFVATRTATVISKDEDGEDSREIQFYGIHTNSVDLSRHQTIILDENGTNQMAEAIGRDNCLVLRLVCDEDVLKKRAKLRGDNMLEFAERIEADKRSFTGDNFDYELNTTNGTAQYVDFILGKLEYNLVGRKEKLQ